MAVFVYDTDGEALLEALQANAVGAGITAVDIDSFLTSGGTQALDAGHAVVSADLAGIKQVIGLASSAGFSVGILPRKGQERLRRYLNLPAGGDAVELALRREPAPIDLVRCNGKIMLFRAIIGWLPMLDTSEDLDRWGFLQRVFRRSRRLRLYPYRIVTANEKKIDTAATGCMIVQRHEGDLVSRLLGKSLSIQDGRVGLVVASPFSMVEYLKFLAQIFLRLRRSAGLPSAAGYMESRGFNIESDKIKDVTIDGEPATQTPVAVEVAAAAVRINVGPALRESDARGDADKEVIRVDNLRSEKELTRSIGHRVPFFSYASEERFRDLFTALMDDAAITTNYVVFMLLSTLIATLGLFVNSAAVIIGAMILAPLMAPMVAVSMALLRDNRKLLFQSLEKIGLGIGLALIAAALTSAQFPYRPITNEMLGRLNPSLPDLFIAIFSGVAAAYARSHKEIAQNLAGVAIAVALVPPLAVAGVGLGRGDIFFFLQAFLLFATNLVGIILAAIVTFRALGYSASVQSKHGLGFVLALVIAVAIPLGISSSQIAARWATEERLESRSFAINGKAIVISDVTISGLGKITANVLVKAPLNAADLDALRRVILDEVDNDVTVELDVHYQL